MSTTVATSNPLLSPPLMDPPNTALPPLPSNNPRKGVTVVIRDAGDSAGDAAGDSAAPPSPTKLRSPSNPLRPSALPTPHHPASTSALPTLRSASSLGKASIPGPSQGLRRTISIALFPQPPNTTCAIGSARSKRPLRVTTATAVNSYQGSQTPSLLNGGGDGKSIPVCASHRVSAGSNPSPPHSRSSSAQESCSTSATTFDDTEDLPRRVRGDAEEVQDMERNPRGKEAKGNVIVSVRVRPDAGGQESCQAEGEWMVVGRKSLVAYRGREGGEYHYGKLGLNPGPQRS